jgi:type I restriction enzyme S subunit
MCLEDLANDVDQRYLYFALLYRTLLDAISGSAQPQITRENLRGVFIPTPPLPEQKKIAAILTSVDDVIESTQKQIDKLQDLKKATMNELLTKGIGHTEFKDSELGRIPKSWDVVFGSDVLKIGGGGSPSKLVFTPNGDFLFMKVDDFNHPENSDGIRVAKLRFSIADNKSIRAFNEGTIVIAKRGAAIQKNRVQILRRKSYIDTNLMAISSDRYDCDFLSYLLTWEDLSKIADTTSVPQLNNFHLNEFQFRFPPIDEQHQISSCLKSLSKRIKSHELKLDQVRNLKKSLMQDLLTGKVRVKVD